VLACARRDQSEIPIARFVRLEHSAVNYFTRQQMIANRISHHYRAWNGAPRLGQAVFQIILSAVIITCLVAPFWPAP
jgi:hypothetical protein